MRHLPTTMDDWNTMVAAERAKVRHAAQRFADVARRGGVTELADALRDVELTGAAPQAFRLAQGIDASPAFRRAFLACWEFGGQGLRDAVDDDLLLIDALRGLLPSYRGKGRVLYRGEGVHAWRARLYGISWTSSKRVALAYARMNARLTTAGGVLIAAYAPAEAIVSSSPKGRYAEAEYLVDRRLIRRPVQVLRRHGPESGEIERHS